MNVALRLAGLGHSVTFLSRVGNDALGRELLDYLGARGLSTEHVQLDDAHPTGTVSVDVSEPNQARYRIEEFAAWDFITQGAEPPRHADAIVYGSLAARHAVSRHSLLQLLSSTPGLKVFDVNLRPPFVERVVIDQLLEHADWLKLNLEELGELCRWYGIAGDCRASATRLAEQHALGAVCVTLGREGAVLYQKGEWLVQPGFEVEVADTIGCGDAFLASWLSDALSGTDLRQALERACAMGALVATLPGANPDISEAQLRALLARAEERRRKVEVERLVEALREGPETPAEMARAEALARASSTADERED